MISLVNSNTFQLNAMRNKLGWLCWVVVEK